jgi:hypothetical protein
MLGHSLSGSGILGEVTLYIRQNNKDLKQNFLVFWMMMVSLGKIFKIHLWIIINSKNKKEDDRKWC